MGNRRSGIEDFWPGLVRLHILHHACRSEVYGLELITELSDRGYRLSPGTIYPILHNMEERGLLRSSEELAGGKIRRVYRATAAGRSAMRTARARVYKLFHELFDDEDHRQPRVQARTRKAPRTVKR